MGELRSEVLGVYFRISCNEGHFLSHHCFTILEKTTLDFEKSTSNFTWPEPLIEINLFSRLGVLISECIRNSVQKLNPYLL